MHYVYILRSTIDKDLYVGRTGDVYARLTKHNIGEVPATRKRRPLKLLTYVAVDSGKKAFDLEKYFKTGSGKAFLKRHLL